MADTVANKVVFQSKRQLVVRSTITSDGTGSTDAVLVDKSTFTGLNGAEPGRLVIEKIEYSIEGMSVALEFDHTADDLIAVLVGQGFIDFSQGGRYPGFVDPASAGGTGDIVGTTTGHTSGDAANFVFYLRKKD
jgi:hypothetical protein